MQSVPQEISDEASPEGAHAHTQRGDAIFLSPLSQEIQQELHSQEPHEAPLSGGYP